jgi:hypothetical protein
MVVVSLCCEVVRYSRMNGHNPAPVLVAGPLIGYFLIPEQTRFVRGGDWIFCKNICGLASCAGRRYRGYLAKSNYPFKWGNVKSHGPDRLG